MDAFHFACLFLSLSIGDIFGYETQPVDAVLFIDGAPTYMRITNSTSLENVYACVLENSKNVNSVIMSTQMKGLIFDVGQIEENFNESIRRLSGRAGQGLWKSEEELKTLKTRLARFLTIDYYDNRLDPEAYLNYKFQRSTDDLSHGRGQPKIYSGWRESSFAAHGQRKESAVTHPTHLKPFLTTAKTNQTSFNTATRKSSSERTATKTYSTTTKHYPSPETTTTYKIIPARSFKRNSSSKPFLLDEYVKPETHPVLNASEIAADVTEKPNNASDTFANTSDQEKNGPSRKIVTAGYAPSPELKTVIEEANASDVFNHTWTKEDDISDWSDTKSFEEGDWEGDDGLGSRRKNEEKRNLKKKSMKGKNVYYV